VGGSTPGGGAHEERCPKVLLLGRGVAEFTENIVAFCPTGQA